MDLNNENTNKIVAFFDIKQKYLFNDDVDKGHYELMYDIINTFDIDRIFIGMKSIFTNECIPLVEYKKNQKPNFWGEVLNFDGFMEFSDNRITGIEQNYINICDMKKYYTGEELNQLLDILPDLGYIKNNSKTLKECLIFYIKNDYSFSYMILEKYETKNETKKLSLIEQLALIDMYNMIKIRIEKDSLKKHLYNEMYMKNIIIENEQMPICLVEKNENRVIYFNDNYEKLMPKVGLGVSYYDLFDDEDTMELSENSKSLILQKNVNEVKYWIKKVVPFNLANGTEVTMIYIKDTIDYIKELEGVDLLTSAFSMTGFIDKFKLLLNKKDKQEYSLCTIDIAKFKYINDTYGFNIGNQILKKISDVLNEFVRKQEFFCRMNDDKFALVLQSNSNDEVQARINTLFERLENMKKQHFLDMKLTYICGITYIDKNVEINILVDRSNSARTSAKGSHKNVMAFFDEEAEKRLKNEIDIETKVAKAVTNGEFVPYLQPKFDLKTMQICGAEALVRWITPTGMIFPDSFIPLFEKNGFIDTLDFIIYQKVMEHIRACLDKNIEVYPISLNVSRNHIHNKNFITQIMDLLYKYKVPIDLIELEITESVFVEDKETLKYFIENIKRPKIKVSIDDFGTAYSSLQVLKDIDIDILKIDKGFLDNIDFTNKHKFTKDEVVLKNIINLAKDLNCKVICEGIETEEQITLLKSIGCELGQGYIFSRPIPLEVYEKDFLK